MVGHCLRDRWELDQNLCLRTTSGTFISHIAPYIVVGSIRVCKKSSHKRLQCTGITTWYTVIIAYDCSFLAYDCPCKAPIVVLCTATPRISSLDAAPLLPQCADLCAELCQNLCAKSICRPMYNELANLSCCQLANVFWGWQVVLCRNWIMTYVFISTLCSCSASGCPQPRNKHRY